MSDTGELWNISLGCCIVRALFLYVFRWISPRSDWFCSIVIVHSVNTINLRSLLCWKSCGMTKCIENSRVPNLCGPFWKRSLICDGIDDLPYWACVRVSLLRIALLCFVLLFYCLRVKRPWSSGLCYCKRWEDHCNFCFRRDHHATVMPPSWFGKSLMCHIWFDDWQREPSYEPSRVDYVSPAMPGDMLGNDWHVWWHATECRRAACAVWCVYWCEWWHVLIWT